MLYLPHVDSSLRRRVGSAPYHGSQRSLLVGDIVDAALLLWCFHVHRCWWYRPSDFTSYIAFYSLWLKPGNACSQPLLA